MKPNLKPTSTLELITPEWAIATLDLAEQQISQGLFHQRPFNEETAHAYAVAMNAGHWLVNCAGIMFDTNGYLRDGRHRLWAVVMSGKSVEMWVIRNCSDKEINGLTVHVVDTIDVGRVRSVGQQLAIDGIPNSLKLGTASRAIARICCGFGKFKLTVIQTRQILDVYGDQINKVMTALHNNNRMMSAHLLGPISMYRHFAAGNADQFCADYHSLQNLSPGSPVIALQKYNQNKTVGSGINSADAIRASCLALLHYERGTSVTALRNVDTGIHWLIEKQRPTCQKIRAIVGVDFRDSRA